MLRQLPGPLERLSVQISRLPWWIIILVIGLLIGFYGIFTTPNYYNALRYETDNVVGVTTDFLNVTYTININGQPTLISGILINQDDKSVTLRTVNAPTQNVPRARVDSIKQVNGQTVFHVPAQAYSGSFYTQTVNTYEIKLADGTIVSVDQQEANRTRQLTPRSCLPDVNGSCKISVALAEQTITGTIASQTDLDYVVQTGPAQFMTIQRRDILTINAQNAGQCALNNLWSCQSGPFLTLYLTLTSYALALVIGLLLALMRISSNLIFRNVAILYIEVVRGIPILVILLLFYFAVGPWITNSLGIPVSEMNRAVLGLGVAYGAFLAEIFRAGIQSINRGQMEAARSLGMSYFEAMRTVILPQAIRVVLPPLGNDFIAILKDTSLVSSIALAELTLLSKQYESSTLQTFPPFLTIGAVYLVMTLSLSVVVRAIEYRSRLPGAAFQ